MPRGRIELPRSDPQSEKIEDFRLIAEKIYLYSTGTKQLHSIVVIAREDNVCLYLFLYDSGVTRGFFNDLPLRA